MWIILYWGMVSQNLLITNSSFTEVWLRLFKNEYLHNIVSTKSCYFCQFLFTQNYTKYNNKVGKGL